MFSDRIEVLEVPDFAQHLLEIKTQEGKNFPSSYVRMLTWSPWAKSLGDRILLLDVDCLLTRTLQPLLDYSDDDFVGWLPNSEWGIKQRIAGGTYLLTPGTHTDLWDWFIADPLAAIAVARAAGYRGSDQALFSYWLAKTATVWPQDSGIYQAQDYGEALRQSRRDRKLGITVDRPEWPLPDDAIICHFNGHLKPWHVKWEWIREHYR
jgi:hypothetical protein